MFLDKLLNFAVALLEIRKQTSTASPSKGMAFYDGGRIGRVTTFLLILQFRLEKEILTEI